MTNEELLARIDGLRNTITMLVEQSSEEWNKRKNRFSSLMLEALAEIEHDLCKWRDQLSKDKGAQTWR